MPLLAEVEQMPAKEATPPIRDTVVLGAFGDSVGVRGEGLGHGRWELLRAETAWEEARNLLQRASHQNLQESSMSAGTVAAACARAAPEGSAPEDLALWGRALSLSRRHCGPW